MTFRAAVVQAGSVLFDTPASIAKLADWTSAAVAEGASLVVFPEAFIGGYPKGFDFGARLGSRTPQGREDFARYFSSAIDVPGAETEQIGEIARKHHAHLVVGAIERDGGTLYCSSLLFGSAGELMAKHRKVMPTALERLVWGFGDGSTLHVTPTPLGNIGSVICWENYMPLLRAAMYAKGVELYCAPTVDDRDVWLPTMRTIAVEGRCFVLSACQYLTGDGGAVLIRGGSCIIDPFGEVLVAPSFDGEHVAIAEVDLRSIIRGKYDLDVVGHYARPDIFTLHVNEQPMSPVIFD
jgi:nitrilase